MTAQQYLEAIPDVGARARLQEAIRSLLRAGRDTCNVRDTLKPQQSFGKYIGCHPEAIKAIADDICRELNRAARQEDRAIRTEVVRSLRESFPDMSKYFKL